ncbi:MAG: spermidine synthase [Chloroflexota bacterium]|nr:spermidine synthase [Chloroflexota bacterium]
MRQAVATTWSRYPWLWSWLRADSPKQPFISSPRARIFLVSFAMLFFELLCIRWIPSYVRYLSYFNNFLLLASFLGIGLGMLTARRQRFWFPPFPLLVVLMAIVVGVNRFELRISSTEVLYYGAGELQASTENFIVLPIIFGMVVICFIPLSRAFGQLFMQVQPLTSYTFDIIGSLIGIACFSIIAYFALPPLVWFGVLALLILLLSSKKTVVATATMFLVSLVVVGLLQNNTYWSPYYKILLHPIQPSGYLVDVNNAGGHQSMKPWQTKEAFYRRVYQLFPGNTFQHALILGAGSGSDVATALGLGVKSVTAVEIDPTIQQLGARLNPDHPYSNPRVHVVINDGRAFLQNTTEHYDLIIFALPDSLTLTSNNTSLRLESFLLTQESLEAARSHLTSNGLVVLYNYYRQSWLVEKLVDMVGHAFNNQEPLVSTYGGWGRAAVIMDGPRLNTLPAGMFGPYHENPANGTQLHVIGEGFYPLTSRQVATDDWPFLYLVEHSFPLLYIAGLVMVAVFALGGTLTLAPRSTLRRFDWHMFFLGVAFMLLEVKSLTTFALLFGSTWLVNSLVFFAILSSVLLAVLVNRYFKIRRIGLFYLLLFAVLVVNLLLPPEALLLGNPLARYLLASILAFTPVFLANIIFTNAFRNSETADIAFASNLLGIMVGGSLEYFSMLFGYRMLLVPVILFYALALLLRRPRRVTEATPAPEPALTT